MMMMLLCSRWAQLWPCCQRTLVHTPVVHRLAIPEPIILVLKSVSSARSAQEPRPRWYEQTQCDGITKT